MVVRISDEERVIRIIETARDLMNDDGKHWIKGASHRKVEGIGDCYCSLGAITQATELQRLKDRHRKEGLQSLARKELKKTIGSRYHGIARWNDSRIRTWEQVDAAFRKTAERLRKQLEGGKK